ncbi:STAS domain-containing protein [Micromonospora sp. CB01531]|uniref:STAS domain-containing protein n=1 Tax=Micromonospora sp. CB01531 TaxID=1718947 RepID=UPI000A75766A|nr:STAS domain-containing protein [Micromonospora sp. CB01531]
MSTRISCEVRDESPATVVRLAGELDVDTMRSVHTVLERCLAAQPDALVVDLGRLDVADPLALSVFAAAARRAADWPAVPLVLCAPPPAAASWLNETTVGRELPVRPDCAEAAALAGAVAAPGCGNGWSRSPGRAGGPGSWSPTAAAGGTSRNWPVRRRWCSPNWSATWSGTRAPRCR